jgi:glycosyltransferase involved in cell wall biosynthesis
MAHKLPVIVSSDCGTNCYIESGQNGYIFEARNIDDLVKKIDTICSDSGTIQRMGQRAFEICQTHHDPRTFVQLIENLPR